MLRDAEMLTHGEAEELVECLRGAGIVPANAQRLADVVVEAGAGWRDALVALAREGRKEGAELRATAPVAAHEIARNLGLTQRQGQELVANVRIEQRR